MENQYEMEQMFEASDFIVKACRRAVADKLTTYYKKMIDEDMFDDLNLGFGKENNKIIDLLKELKGKTDNILDTKNGKNNHCFFTVNFKKDIAHEDAHKAFSDFAKSSVYLKESQYIWSLEQRSTTIEDTHGYHVHCLFTKGSNSPSKIQRAFKTKFVDKYCDPQALDYKYIENPDNMIKYTLGIKDDKDKDAKVKIDRIFKQTNGYENYYTQGNEYLEKINKIWAENNSTDLPALPCFSEIKILKDNLKSGI